MLTDPVSVSRSGLATSIKRGVLVNLLLVSWPAFGLAGLGAIFHAADVGAYVTQATTTNVPPDGPVGIEQLKRFVTQASGVTFVLDDIWDGRDDKVFGIFSEDGGGVVREWPLVPEIAGRVTGLAAPGGRIEVRWNSWRPDDPRCCPSLTHETTFILREGQAVPAK